MEAAKRKMEKELKIKTSDKKQIYGILRGSLHKPLVVFVHGLTGNMNEHQFFNGARYFEKKGFSSFRFDLYSWQKDARKLHNCTLQTHADDMDRVVEYFRRKGVKKIFVVGHSYGGKTILLSHKKGFDGAALWDPSNNFHPLFDKSRYVKSLGGYIKKDESPYAVLMGKRMVEQEKKFPWKKIKEIHVPIKIIVAGEGVLIRGGKQYYEAANKPKAFAVIKDASHYFDEDGAEERLFQETISWFWVLV